MFREIVLLVGITIFTACATADIPSVRILAEYEKSKSTISQSDDNYLIGPGDILSIDVWDDPKLSKQVSVRLDGHITLLLVNEVEVTGLTCTELRNKLLDLYKEYDTSIYELSVTVVESVNNKFYISGQINTPGEYTLQKHMTILQAISRAGGLNEWAKASDIRLIRKINGVDKTYRVDYNAIVSGNDLSQNIQLKVDDTIYVP